MQLPYFRFFLGSFGDFGKHFQKWGNKELFDLILFLLLHAKKMSFQKCFFSFLPFHHMRRLLFKMVYMYSFLGLASYELDYYDVVVYVM